MWRGCARCRSVSRDHAEGQYRDNPTFRELVDHLIEVANKGELAPGEVREAAFLAAYYRGLLAKQQALEVKMARFRAPRKGGKR